MRENINIADEQNIKLKYAHLAPAIWNKLGEIERTGWVKRGVQNPETVQEHTVSLIKLANSLEGLNVEEKDGLIDMLEIHDWVEAITGDIVALNDGSEDYKVRKEEKNSLEQKAMNSIKDSLGEKGMEIFELWNRFESSNDPAAKLARELDKYQAVEKALEYEQSQGIKLFREFYDYSFKNISHPVLLQKLDSLTKK